MKKIVCSLMLIVALVATSCAKRTTIPDEELALIFRDAFLANAYVLNHNIHFDTLQVYQPIFDRYGYSADDVAYTVGSFSKRKSARLSDVVERSIKLLEEGQRQYSSESTILDSIDAIATRATTRRFFEKSYIEYYKLQDTVNLLFEFDSIKPGRYDISFEYRVDSLDNNRSSYRVMTWFEAPESSIRKGVSSTHLRKNIIHRFNRSVDVDTLTHKFVINLAESYEVKRTPHVTFRNMTIDYTPPTEEAVDQLFRDKLDVRIFADEFFGTTELQPTDSLVVPSI